VQATRRRAAKPPRIGSNRPHLLLQEQAGKDAGHGPAVLHHVGNSAFLEAGERPSRTSQPYSRVKIR
jgi:hypothetical protein